MSSLIMDKLFWMASHGCPPGNGLAFVQEQTRGFKDLQPYFPGHGARHEIKRPTSLSMEPHHSEPLRPLRGFCGHTQFAKLDALVARPVLIDVQDTCPDSIHFSFEIAEQCSKQEKILKFLSSGSSELEKGGLDLSLLSDSMDIQAFMLDAHQHPSIPLVYPNGNFAAPKPLVDFVGDLAHSSKITVHPDGRVLFTGSGTEIKGILSIVAKFYLSKTSTKWRKPSALVPHFSWPNHATEAQPDVGSLNVKDVKTPLKGPSKIKLKPSKKKSSRKVYKERDFYERNYFRACESLLSLMMDKKQHRKAAILSLKKSGPELPGLLTQFSAGIAGTGLAVLFSVVCKLACGRVPFCATKLFNTGFGFGLVWLSWAVNKLRDTIIYISKNSSKLGLKDEEMLKSVDRRLKDIYFSAATLLVVAALRIA